MSRLVVPIALLVPLLVALLGGCGAGASTSSTAPATGTAPATATAPTTTFAPGPGAVKFDEVAIVTATAAGGRVSAGTAVVLSDEASVRRFGAQFESSELADQVGRAVERTDVPVGTVLYAAVVAIGCDVPSGVVVTRNTAGVAIAARPAEASGVQCLAPVTSVAVVLVTS